MAYGIEATDYNVVEEEIQGYGVSAELMWNWCCWMVIKWIRNGFELLGDSYGDVVAIVWQRKSMWSYQW